MKDGVKLYKFSCSVASAQIDTQIAIQFYNGTVESEVFFYSVQDYLTLAQTSMADDAKFMTLASSLATYGYYANELFQIDPDFTQHALFDDSGFAAITPASLSAYEEQNTNTENGVTHSGSSLVMRTTTTIRQYFKLPAGTTVDDFTFLLGEGSSAVALTPKRNGSNYYVEVPDIASAKLGTAYTMTVLDGDGNVFNTWICSAMSYAFKALTKAAANDPSISAELVNAVKAMTVYYQAATAYFA